jgi:hypothetical protein
MDQDTGGIMNWQQVVIPSVLRRKRQTPTRVLLTSGLNPKTRHKYGGNLVALGLSLTLAACGTLGYANTPQTSVPSELSGEWLLGTVSSVDFYNPNTGTWGNPSGSGLFYKLNRDGTFNYGFREHVTNQSCETDLFIFKKGTVAVKGATFTLYPTSGQKHYQDCTGSSSEDRPLSANELSPDAYTWSVVSDQTDPAKQTLVLTTPSGATGTLRHP